MPPPIQTVETDQEPVSPILQHSLIVQIAPNTASVNPSPYNTCISNQHIHGFSPLETRKSPIHKTSLRPLPYNSLPTGPSPVRLTTFLPSSHALPRSWKMGGTGMVLARERCSWMSRRAMLMKEAREKMEIVSRVSRRMLMWRWVVW